MRKRRWILAGTALFSVMWFFVSPDVVLRFGDPEVAGWVPFWMIPVSIVELVLFGAALRWPNKTTMWMFYIAAFVQLVVGFGFFPR